ncbi:ABC transporter permease [Alphaproteobacteria bacterium]|nr:ABC transporter permease [Alphaproteobacteria bacterium]
MDFLVNWLAATPVFAVPLILASIGLIINERAGVLNLGAEGIMLCGALAGIAFYIEISNNVAVALFGAMFAGIVLSFFFGFLIVLLRANQVVSGITLVFFGSGLTGFIGPNWADKTVKGIEKLDLFLLSDLPFLGRIFFSQDLMVYITLVLGLFVWWVLFFTRFGLQLRAVGDNPQASDSNAINVTMYRLSCVIIGGALIGLAGGYLSLASAKVFAFDMTYGRGWIAIALVIFARWSPWRAILGGLLFGSIEALIPRVLATGIAVPQYFLHMTPYFATLVVLIYAAIRDPSGQGAPNSLGTPYIREDRK